MQSQSAGLPLGGSEPASCGGGDGDQFEPYTVLRCGVLPDAINLGRQKEFAQDKMTPHQLRELALKLQDNPHVTALDLSNQCIGPDMMLELVGHFTPLTSLRELNLSGALASSSSNST